MEYSDAQLIMAIYIKIPYQIYTFLPTFGKVFLL